MTSVTKIVLVSAASVVGSAIVAGLGYFKGKADGKTETLNGPVMQKLEQVLHGEIGAPMREPSVIAAA